MDDLVTWLRQQLDVDVAAADDVERIGLDTLIPAGIIDRSGATVYFAPDVYARVCGVLDPARVLREVEAKRRIVTTAEWFRERAAEVENERTYDMDDWRENERLRVTAKVLIDTLSVIAAVYSDRPGYRKEWRP